MIWPVLIEDTGGSGFNHSRQTPTNLPSPKKLMVCNLAQLPLWRLLSILNPSCYQEPMLSRPAAQSAGVITEPTGITRMSLQPWGRGMQADLHCTSFQGRFSGWLNAVLAFSWSAGHVTPSSRSLRTSHKPGSCL